MKHLGGGRPKTLGGDQPSNQRKKYRIKKFGRRLPWWGRRGGTHHPTNERQEIRKNEGVRDVDSKGRGDWGNKKNKNGIVTVICGNFIE